jgi:hypothetical protein
MSRSAFGSAARINLRELRRRAIKLPMKKLGHVIEDWVAINRQWEIAQS